MPTSRPPLIRFAAVSFDPLTDRQFTQRSAPAAPTAESSPARTIVQFTAPLTLAEQTRLKQSYGLALRDYVPDNAYLERLSAATLEKLARDPLVRATVPYEAAFKIVPGIGEQKFTTEERRAVQGVWVTCVLFRDADPEGAAIALRMLGARQVVVVDDRRHGGAPKINLIVDSTAALPAPPCPR